MQGDLFFTQFFNLYIFPGHFIWTASFFDGVNLQSNESFGVGFVFFLVCEIGNLITIYPGLNTGTFGNNTVLVPFTILKVFMRSQITFGSHPSTQCFSIYIA